MNNPWKSKLGFKLFKDKMVQTSGSVPVVCDMENIKLDDLIDMMKVSTSEPLKVAGQQMGKTAMTTEWLLKELQKPPSDFLEKQYLDLHTAKHNVGFDLAFDHGFDLAVPTGSSDLIKQQAVASFAKAFDEAFKTNFAKPPEQFEVCSEVNPCRDPLPPVGGRPPGELRWVHEDVDVEKDIVYKRVVLCCRHCSLVREYPLHTLENGMPYTAMMEWVKKEMTL